MQGRLIMFIKMQCLDTYDFVLPEICSFHGFRYDKVNRSAIISTEHTHHDYIIPLDEEDYHKLEQAIWEKISQGQQMIELVGGDVLRVRRGEIRRAAPLKNLTVF